MRCCRVSGCLSDASTTKIILILLLQFGLLCIIIQRSIDFPKYYQTNVSVKPSSHTLLPEDSKGGLIEEINAGRVTRVRQFCRLHRERIAKSHPDYELRKRSITKWIWMASPHHHLFYCATTKCGSTTWKSYLMEDLGIDWHEDTHVSATEYLGSYSILRKSQKTAIGFLKSYRPANRLIIVRNPWARLVSAYSDKVLVKKWPLERLCYGWRKYTSFTNITFEQFIDCVLQKPKRVMYEAHTHPLVSLCGICYMDYNMILKLEEMDQAEPYLMKQLNFTIQPKYKPLNKMKYSNVYRDYYQRVPAEQIQQLNDLYREDIELFDYPPTPFD